MTPQQFSAQVKAKYPTYAGVDDTTLAKQIIAKYPVYASQVNFGVQPTAPVIQTPSFVGTQNNATSGSTQAIPDSSTPDTGTALVNTAKSLVSGTVEVGKDISAVAWSPMIQAGLNKIDKADQQFLTNIIQKRQQIKASGQDTSHYDNLIKNYQLTNHQTVEDIFPALKKSNEQVLGDFGSMFLEMLGASSGLASASSKIAGTAKVVSTGQKILKSVEVGAAYGTGFGATGAMQQNASPTGILKSAVVGGVGGAVVGAGTSAALEGIKYAVKGTPKLLSYTSNTPEDILQRNFDNPSAMAEAGSSVKTGGVASVRENTQNAVKTLRKTLSSQWDEGMTTLIDTNQGARASLTTPQTKLLDKIVSQYGIEVPKDTSNMSIKELLDLNKNINELYNKADVKMGSGGIIVRQFKDVLDGAVSKFTGASDFLSNYATEKQVLDNANAIVKAWNGSPISMKTVEGRLQKVFDENSSAYLSALKDLQDKTGINILDGIAALQTQKVLPKGQFGGSATKQLIKTLGLVFTSPKGAAFWSRVAGSIAKKL
jgi:hypothetical protein